MAASSNSFLCFHLRGPEVEQDQSRGCVCPVGGALDAEGLSEGWGRRRSTMERTNQQTGMHRPWGDFCVYRSALTPGAESECGVQRVKGMRALSVLCLPFPPFLADRAALFPVLLVLRSAKVRPRIKLAPRIGYLNPFISRNCTRNLPRINTAIYIIVYIKALAFLPLKIYH